MSLEQLQQLESDAKSIDSEKWKIDRAEKELAAYRNSSRSLVEVVIMSGQWSGYDENKKLALHEVINECKLELLRLAELRLAAKSRELKIQAAQLRAIITASILPLPEQK